jgi:hypothetical protein
MELPVPAECLIARKQDRENRVPPIVTGSPMLQSLMMMCSNPMLLGSDGGKLDRVGGEKAVVKYSAQEKGGNINPVIANRFLVTIEGNDVSLEDLKAYAGKIDYKKLAALQ